MSQVIKPNRQITKHFTYDECRCPCCDGLRIVDTLYNHMTLLEIMRVRLGFAIIINSGYRCLNHNDAVDGRIKSWHLLFATDVRPCWGTGFDKRLAAMYKTAKDVGFKGIGRYKSRLHLDTRAIQYFYEGSE